MSKAKMGLLLSAILSGAMALTACLPESQETKDLRAKAIAAAQEVIAQREVYAKAAAEVKQLVADAKVGKAIDQARLLELMVQLPAVKDATAAVLAKAQDTYDALKKSQGAPWYSYLITALGVAGTVASVYFPVLKPALVALHAAQGQRDAVITGVESYRKAPEDAPGEVEDFIRKAAEDAGVQAGLHAQVKALTGDTNCPPAAS